MTLFCNLFMERPSYLIVMTVCSLWQRPAANSDCQSVSNCLLLCSELSVRRQRCHVHVLFHRMCKCSKLSSGPLLSAVSSHETSDWPRLIPCSCLSHEHSRHLVLWARTTGLPCRCYRQVCLAFLYFLLVALHTLSELDDLCQKLVSMMRLMPFDALRACCSKHRLELTTRLTQEISPVNSWRVVPCQNPRVKTHARLTRELKLTSG